MKSLFWKFVIIVPLGVGIAAFIVSRIEWFQQTGADQTKPIGKSIPYSAPGKLAAAAVLAIEPKVATFVSRPSSAQHTPTVIPTVMQELHGAQHYKPVFDRLQATPEGDTAEGLYAKYVVLSSCATLIGKQEKAARLNSLEERRRQFFTSLSDSDPHRALRLAAYEKLDGDRCDGFENFLVSDAELSQFLERADKAGDPKARAARVEKEMWSAYRGASGRGATTDNGPGLPTLAENQIESLKGAILSKDPEAMLIAGRVLSNSIDNLTLQIGPDWQNIDQSAFYHAWQLLGCDYGMNCGSSHPKVLASCAYQGLCATNSLADNLYYYGNSPYQSQLLDQYRSTLKRVVNTGDWSQIRFARGSNPAGTRYFVRGGP